MKNLTLEQAKALKNEASELYSVLFNKMFYGPSEQAEKTQRILHKADKRSDRRVELYADIKWPQRKNNKV